MKAACAAMLRWIGPTQDAQQEAGSELCIDSNLKPAICDRKSNERTHSMKEGKLLC